MGRRGPPPKPTHLRVIQGNPGKRPLPKDEPKPRPVRPERPDARWSVAAIYEKLASVTERMGVLTEADGFALLFAAQAMKDAMTEEARARKRGADWRTRKHARDARGQALLFLREFGLSASSRTRIRVEKPDMDEFEEFLRHGEG